MHHSWLGLTIAAQPGQSQGQAAERGPVLQYRQLQDINLSLAEYNQQIEALAQTERYAMSGAVGGVYRSGLASIIAKGIHYLPGDLDLLRRGSGKQALFSLLAAVGRCLQGGSNGFDNLG